MIAMIDYGAGNMLSVINAFEAIGQKIHVTRNPEDLAKARAIVLPGVGAFGDGMETLRRLKLTEMLSEQVLVKKKPYLGICLGLQFLARESFEHGLHRGLGWIEGTVKKIVPDDPEYRIPHMGWNNLQIKRPTLLFDGLAPDPDFYFVHSYHLVSDQICEPVVTSTCWHGETITASIQREHIFGVQFHPEKSQGNGLQLLKNFVKLI